ncbi:ATP-binding protein [Micromonospora carbonacea]|uniref:ATP-binding protein n=1 Tax=Micromonospora carbonacea TaxID=47853 RepID=UPI00210D26E8|nr:ATP-binding protein [Micromonospora carbonacea]
MRWEGCPRVLGGLPAPQQCSFLPITGPKSPHVYPWRLQARARHSQDPGSGHPRVRADQRQLALLGPPGVGVGKPHIAVALAVAACRAGFTVYLTSLDDMVRDGGGITGPDGPSPRVAPPALPPGWDRCTAKLTSMSWCQVRRARRPNPAAPHVRHVTRRRPHRRTAPAPGERRLLAGIPTRPVDLLVGESLRRDCNDKITGCLRTY